MGLATPSADYSQIYLSTSQPPPLARLFPSFLAHISFRTCCHQLQLNTAKAVLALSVKHPVLLRLCINNNALAFPRASVKGRNWFFQTNMILVRASIS